MIWLDIIDPKYVLFFKELIPLLPGEILITTRSSPNYQETRTLLDLYGLPYVCFGGRGESLEEKYHERLKRSQWFLTLFKDQRPDLLVVGASVEAVQSAFALQIPIAYFLDTPSLGLDPKEPNLASLQPTKLAKLSAPLADVIFAPFVVPKSAYQQAGAHNVLTYPFIDPVLWINTKESPPDFRQICGLKTTRPTILVREEEQAHYVRVRSNLIYESVRALNALDVNIALIARYDPLTLQQTFQGLENVYVLEQKFSALSLYAYSDVMVGGGGTMNLESCYFGLPTISTRSLWLYHDCYLLQHGLMAHASTPLEVLDFVQKSLALYGKDTHASRLSIQAKRHQKAKRLFIKGKPNFDFFFEAMEGMGGVGALGRISKKLP
ncbi:DUF354 domain-containing protein [Helicobacter bizzozeronii]|uniref:DUF354 domain-containing protein n=1 Tax=Helicobacter bizzozeronii TaxID=56877 RepID=UPI000CED884A|nr:DUF354 domain-containing protein [Helicobacter bizzozeronii]